jgi:acyl-CoA thioester hydrolase
VRTVFAAAKGVRLLIDQTILRGDELIAEASIEAVCLDLAGRARRPPAALKTALSPLLPPSP